MKALTCILIVVLAFLWSCAGVKPAPETSEAQLSGHRETAKGIDWLRKGCRRRAWDAFLKSHRYFTLAGDAKGAAMALNNMGTVYRTAGELSSALVFFEEAIEIYRQFPDDDRLLQALSNRAAVLIDGGRLEDAARAMDAARRVQERLGIPFPALGINAGLYYWKKGDLEAAKSALEAAVQETGPGDFLQTARARSALGRLLLEMDRAEAALSHLESALAADRAFQNFPGIAGDLEAIGRVYLKKGELSRGATYLKQSLFAHAALGDKKKAEAILSFLERTCSPDACGLEGVRHLVSQYFEGPLSQGLCD
ncbi:MAG: tetratricopeptide repeat-containing protein [Deltaproteobacteria bacterium]|nr:tetratricopeptide repeat-containing protein [Deltaproteobacteria bacterium]